jgi:hypothetical protein
MELLFKGKVALVTGAASGMGLATARAFANAGAAVVLADQNESADKEAAEQIVAQGGRAIPIGCNVADEKEVQAMIGAAVAKAAKSSTGSTRSARCLELHGIRIAADARAGQWCDCQLFVAWRSGRDCGPRCLARVETWCAWTHEERRARVCHSWHSYQCRMPRDHRDADGDGHARQRAGSDEGTDEGAAHWPARQTGGDRRRRIVALQSGVEFCHRTFTGG